MSLAENIFNRPMVYLNATCTVLVGHQYLKREVHLFFPFGIIFCTYPTTYS